MTKPDIATADMAAAARWLATTPDTAKPRPVLPYLQKAYGLSAGQAVAAIRESQLIRARAS